MRNDTIGSVCRRFSSGKSLSSTKISDVGLYPVIGANGIRGYTDSYNFDGSCAVIGRQGAYCGNVRYFEGKAYMTEHAIVAEANDKNNSGYLALRLKFMNLSRYQGQSAQPGLSVETLSHIPITMPSLEKQTQIFNAINYINQQISNNVRKNQEISKLSKLIYNYWFVQFDFPDKEGSPYKSSGGKMVWEGKIKSEIPKNWIVTTLGELAEYVNLKVPNDQLTPDTYVGNDNLLNEMGGKCKSEYVPVEGVSTEFKIGDILLGNIRPYFHKIWYADCGGGCSADVLCIRARVGIPSEFLYAVLARSNFFDYVMAGSKGSKMPRGDKAHIMKYPVIFNKEIANKFANIISGPYQLSQRLRRENIELLSLRDFLIPLLLRGRVTFKKEI